MIRTPLRPLARIIAARQTGQNPDQIERENLRKRHEHMQDRSRQSAESRLLVMGAFLLLAFMLVGMRMGALAASEPTEPRASATGAAILAERADIVDRRGRILATNFVTHSLYAQPPIMVDKVGAAAQLARIFPDLDEQKLFDDFNGKRKFIWIKKRISPEQLQQVHDIGDPGLLFGPREMRLYPNGRVAAHVLGGSSFGREGVHAAEIIGVAGVEKAFDETLRDPARGDAPLELSLDLTVQAATEQVLFGSMKLLNAKGAAAVLMDVHTGEVISLVSLPDFDPNSRPAPATTGHPDDTPLFNRAVQGLYELGSVFKAFTVANAMERGLVHAGTQVDTTGPLRWGKHKIRDFRNYGKSLSVTDVLVKSSNIGTARIAQAIGADEQQDFLGALGLLQPTSIELVEAAGAVPLRPKNWSEISTMTISFGHGMSSSPLHLAAAYATIANGGTRIKPTILRQSKPQRGERVLSADTSAEVMSMLRQVVTRGTASFGEVEGYAVAGKTGTADKPKRTGGGYHDEKVIATFASAFPAHNPKYVLIVSLDEPTENSGDEPRRTAGWTAVPVAAEIIARVAPLLGLRPQIELAPSDEITLAANR